MQVQCINKLQYSYNFQKKENKVIEEGDYVKIPQDKYKKDKIKEKIVVGILLLEVIREIYKLITEKLPKL